MSDSLFSLIPEVAWHSDVMRVSMKSGIAWERGSMMPNPPPLMLNWEIIIV